MTSLSSLRIRLSRPFGRQCNHKDAWEPTRRSRIVEKEVKGGYEVTVAGSALLSFSRSTKIKKESADTSAATFDFLFSEYTVDDRGLNVVVSRRAIIEQQRRLVARRGWPSLTRADVKGTIPGLMDFGAFVDLGASSFNRRARSRGSESRTFNTVLKAGDGVTVKVLHIDRDAGKISLSRKECMTRVFNRSSDEESAAKSAEEVAEWMKSNDKRNANVGSMASAFDGLNF